MSNVTIEIVGQTVNQQNRAAGGETAKMADVRRRAEEAEHLGDFPAAIQYRRLYYVMQKVELGSSAGPAVLHSGRPSLAPASSAAARRSARSRTS